MPIFYIPTIGERIRLAEDWEFTLYDERRNVTLMKALGLLDPNATTWGRPYPVRPAARVTLPKDTVLTVSRIYIRSNLRDYDSVTFVLTKKTCSDPRIRDLRGGQIRFWVKLNDINNVFFETVEDDNSSRKMAKQS